MEQEHLAEEILIAYADAPESLTGLADINAHLDGCDECWTRVEDYRVMAVEMRDPAAWTAAGEGDVEVTAPATLGRFEERLAREDADAERLLANLIDDRYRFNTAKLLRRRRLQTGGVVRLLCRWAHVQTEKKPLFALSLAEAAMMFAEGLPDDYYPAAGVYELRGTAWKEYAMACGELGHHSDGLQALVRAERAYKHLLEPTVSLGTIDLARAITLFQMERHDDALPPVWKAAEGFARAGDSARYLDAKQAEAGIHHRKGDFQAAIIAYRTLYEAGTASCDADMVARAAHNMGVVYVERGDIGLASRFFLEALQIVEELGLKARAAKCRWGIAWVALAAGNFTEADRRFSAVDEEMAKLGMTDTAPMKLQHAEALLMLGRFAEVEALARQLVATFRAAGRITGALTAAVFLQEAATARTLSRRQVQQVREYYVRLERKPQLLFVAPDGDGE